MKKMVCIVLLSLQTCMVLAQQGPIIECHNCDGLSGKPLPVQGNWFNPQQSGSGYLIDVQNGILSGFYFGYTEEGEPTWLSFNGTLQASEDENVNWFVELPLTKISGGNAFNQPHQFPTDIVETGDVIKLNFHFAHYASVQINDGDVQSIIPINYGVAEEQDFEESDYQFPDLQGVWTYVLHVNNDPIFGGLFAYFSDDFYISPKGVELRDDGTTRMSYQFTNWLYPETVGFSTLNCFDQVNLEAGSNEVICELTNFPNIGDRMPIAPGNIGPNYIYAENANGDVFEAFRVNYIPNYGIPVDGK